jgi:N-acetylmuramoyl-L-alanine amidase
LVIGTPLLQTSRTTAVLVTFLVFVLTAPPGAQDGPLTLISRDGRRALPTTVTNGRELVALEDVAALFQVIVREDTLAGGITVSYKGRTIVASADQPMASVDGRIVTLPSPAVRSGRRWLVPIEFLPRALGPIYDQRIDLRRASRLVIVGDLRVPRVAARIDAAGPPTRVALMITPATPVVVNTDGGRVSLRIDADAVEPTFPAAGSGLVESIRTGDLPNTIVVVLSRLAGMARTAVVTVDGTTRVTIEVPAAPTPPPGNVRPPDSKTQAPDSRGPEPELRLPIPEPQQALTIVIDPGHGGDEVGVRGADGLEEKQLTLDVARRLRSLIESRLGVRVILTRDDDRTVSIDERAAAANNGKADLLLSLHANGSLSASPSGAEVFYERLDREGEAVKREAAAGAISLPVLGGGTRTIDVIPWDLAQARHIDASARLAMVLEEELRRQVPMSQRPLQQAPMRLLSAANMPAALVEMAYLTSADQEKLAGRDEFRNAVAQALYNAIVRFRAYLEETPNP